ncbi:hypothetical protein CEUSTIGMA_g4921.t1 [Chlamydomonas eustigma]|uniref:Methyltransferase domain-containing protein n=1 Tax=Chlamydomonas eustigma TaxID=1157962 RepID=A0A250X326_9CHLO|nr:hypothetical protein CEUSTIGMA_g4921.t1 [Chlamydomonas eustigma]|eukprot:GAX77477.1 hypothetical protein CEUSTIGMA_g4921.t1 [Chlamydomonas eustigma]
MALHATPSGPKGLTNRGYSSSQRICAHLSAPITHVTPFRQGPGNDSKPFNAATAPAIKRSILGTSASQKDVALGEQPSFKGDESVMEAVLSAIADESSFKEITFKGRAVTMLSWKELRIRPVLLKGKKFMQFSFFSTRQNIAKNYEPSQAAEQITELLGLPWGSIQIKSSLQDINIQISRRGKAIFHRTSRNNNFLSSGQAQLSSEVASSSSSSSQSTELHLQHDRVKALPISPMEAHPFLQKLGMQTQEGRIKSDMQDKFNQVNEFLKLLGHTGAWHQLKHFGGVHSSHTLLMPSPVGLSKVENSSDATWKRQEEKREVLTVDRTVMISRQPDPGQETSASLSAAPHSSADAVCPEINRQPKELVILDCGCGSSHLTFGTYHYLNNVLGLPSRIVGVDMNTPLMNRSNEYCRQLDLSPEEAQFFSSPILGFSPPAPPNVVLALHACDTATDEALALGVQQGAAVIMAVPCCHKHLHKEIKKGNVPYPLRPLMGHGIMRQRYKTDAVEFISAEHTPRNLLIRASKASDYKSPGSTADKALTWNLLKEYDEMKVFWGGVTPYLETLISAQLQIVRLACEQSEY